MFCCNLIAQTCVHTRVIHRLGKDLQIDGDGNGGYVCVCVWLTVCVCVGANRSIGMMRYMRRIKSFRLNDWPHHTTAYIIETTHKQCAKWTSRRWSELMQCRCYDVGCRSVRHSYISTMVICDTSIIIQHPATFPPRSLFRLQHTDHFRMLTLAAYSQFSMRSSDSTRSDTQTVWILSSLIDDWFWYIIAAFADRRTRSLNVCVCLFVCPKSTEQ